MTFLSCRVGSLEHSLHKFFPIHSFGQTRTQIVLVKSLIQKNGIKQSSLVKLLLHCQAMSTSEEFYLRLNDFQENVSTAFRDLRKDCDFTDVTLACMDGHQVEAHKVILSASSPFFQKLLKSNKHAHPLIYMKGMKSEDLMAIVDFLYYGEVNINHEHVDTFLKIAEEFQLKGLNGTEDGSGEEKEDAENTKKQHYNPIVPSTGIEAQNNKVTKHSASQNSSVTPQTNPKDQMILNTAVFLPKPEFSGDIKELDEKIKSLMCRVENMIRRKKQMEGVFVCKICGKEALKRNIKVHIEGIHLDGISVPCNRCEKTLGSREALRRHNSSFHRDKKGLKLD